MVIAEVGLRQLVRSMNDSKFQKSKAIFLSPKHTTVESSLTDITKNHLAIYVQMNTHIYIKEYIFIHIQQNPFLVLDFPPTK